MRRRRRRKKKRLCVVWKVMSHCHVAEKERERVQSKRGGANERETEREGER